jgi:hypothetical protein
MDRLARSTRGLFQLSPRAGSGLRRGVRHPAYWPSVIAPLLAVETRLMYFAMSPFV